MMTREEEYVSMSVPSLVSLEFTVTDLEPCLRLFGHVLGLDVAGPVRHDVLDADVAQVRTGGLVITFVRPTSTGTGMPHSSPDQRLSQLNFEVPGDDMDDLRSRLEKAGAPVVAHDESLFYIDATMVSAMLGADASLVFTASADVESAREG